MCPNVPSGDVLANCRKALHLCPTTRHRTRRRVLVIEPRPRDLTPADTTSLLPAGGPAEAIRAHVPVTVGVVIEAAIAHAEIVALRDRAAGADPVVLGTVDSLGQPSVASLARALVASGTPVVAVALRGPWDANAYREVGTVLATDGIQAPNRAALVAAPWRDATVTGLLPVRVATAKLIRPRRSRAPRTGRSRGRRRLGRRG